MAQHIKVLMVDDEVQFSATTARILNKKGFNTTIARTGEEALDILARLPQDVVVLDIMMPGMDGHEALAQIKRNTPHTQVIMLTGHGGLASAKNALTRGAYDYLTKPCDIDLLAAKITSAYDAAGKKDLKREKNAGDIMIHVEDYTTLFAHATVAEAISALRRSFEGLVSSSRLMETGHRSLLVFETDGDIAGILSIADLMAAIRPEYLSAPKPSLADSMQYSALFWTGLFTRRTALLGRRKIRDIMSECPPKITADTNLMEVADLMVSRNARRLVVMEKGSVAGIVREQEMFFEISHILEISAV